MKYAVLSMDIEDWYHLDYFRREHCDCTYSMLDGVSNYCEILSDHQVPSSFFVLGELADPLKGIITGLANSGYDVGTHGFDHRRPTTMSFAEFQYDVVRCKRELEDRLGAPVLGYRAPCFSLDKARLDILQEVEFKYDSSKIAFGDHPLYADLDMKDFTKISNHIFRRKDFVEFEVSTLPLCNKNIPVSGGGYLRIFPWMITKNLLKKYLQKEDLYILYIHPFELSSKGSPSLPSRTHFHNRIRFATGRKSVSLKLVRLIRFLKKRGYVFTTFSALRKVMIEERGSTSPSAKNQ